MANRISIHIYDNSSTQSAINYILSLPDHLKFGYCIDLISFACKTEDMIKLNRHLNEVKFQRICLHNNDKY